MPHSSRHVDALRIALYNLHKLDQHICMSRRVLNDLRTLRPLIGQERTGSVRKTKPEWMSALPAGHSGLSADDIERAA